MARTLDDTLKVLKGRARKLGGEQAELHKALDKHYSSEVAKTLTDLLATRQISQQELGRRASVQQAEVSRILAGRIDPRVSTLRKLAHAMGAELRVVPRVSARTARIAAPRRNRKKKGDGNRR